jgi:hypothetical protein
LVFGVFYTWLQPSFYIEPIRSYRYASPAFLDFDMPGFDFKRSSKRCSVTDRAFAPGEKYISALIEVDDDLERRDFSMAEWTEPPEDCVGWWTTQVPEATEGRVFWAPDEVLLSYLEHLRESPGHEDVAYVMTLLLVRKKLFSLEEFVDSPSGQQMVVLNRRAKETLEVPVVDLPPNRMTQIQNELEEKLFTDQPLDLDAPEGTDEVDG